MAAMRTSICTLVCVATIAIAAPARAQLSLGRRLDAPRATELPAPARAPAGDDSGTALLVGGAIAVAIAAIGIGAWAYAFARIQDINADPTWDAYRTSVPAGTSDVCVVAAGDTVYGPPGAHAHARGICDEGGTLEIVEWISLGTAIAASAIAAGLFVAGDRASQPELTFAPVIGPGLAGASLTLRL